MHFPDAISFTTRDELCECSQGESKEDKKERNDQKKDLSSLNSYVIVLCVLLRFRRQCEERPLQLYHAYFIPYEFHEQWCDYTGKEKKEKPSSKIDTTSLRYRIHLCGSYLWDRCIHGKLKFNPTDYWRSIAIDVESDAIAPQKLPNRLFRVIDVETRNKMRSYGYKFDDIPCSTSVCVPCMEESKSLALVKETNFEDALMKAVYQEKKKPRTNRRKAANSADGDSGIRFCQFVSI